MGSRYERYSKMSIPEVLAALDTDAQAGSDTYQLLQNVLLGKSAQAVNDGLVASAVAVGKSTAELGPKLDRLNQELGETKAKIETAGKRVSEVADQRAQEIGANLQGLAAELVRATAESQAANAESARLRGRLNWLTAALFFAAVVTAGATVFQAVEAKRQADAAELQLRQAAPQPRPLPPAGQPAK